jgi:hypothetical protein
MSCSLSLKCVAAAMIIMLLSMSTRAQDTEDLDTDTDLEAAKAVKDYYADWLSSIPGVSAVTVASSNRGEPEIKIDVEQMTPQIKKIPDKLNGIPVVIAPVSEAEGEPVPSPAPFQEPGFMPAPTPEVESSPAPTPQGNKFWPPSLGPINPNP